MGQEKYFIAIIFMTKTSTIFKIILLAGLFFSFVLSARGAVVYSTVDSPDARVGDTVVVTLFLDTQGEVVNTIEGSFSFKSGSREAVIKDFSLAGSDFSYWPHRPSFSLHDGVVSFVGGAPGGVSGSAIVLFKAIALMNNAGTISVTPGTILVYPHDGSGMAVSAGGTPFSFSVSKQIGMPRDSWETILSQDTIPPTIISTEFGKDSGLFDGKRFVSIQAVDEQSGVDYFEIFEDGHPSAIFNSPFYVLANQSDSARVTIAAYDKAGNKTITTISSSPRSYWWYLFGLCLVAIFFVVVWKIIKRKKSIQWE